MIAILLILWHHGARTSRPDDHKDKEPNGTSLL